jgi:hypothetical protein
LFTSYENAFSLLCCLVAVLKEPQLTKRVGRMFGEFFEIPNKKFEFVRQHGAGGMSTTLARPLNGGLPAMPSDALTLLYPQRTIQHHFRFAN